MEGKKEQTIVKISKLVLVTNLSKNVNSAHLPINDEGLVSICLNKWHV